MKFQLKIIPAVLVAGLSCHAHMALADQGHSTALALDIITVTEKRDVLGVSMTQPDIERARAEINKTAGAVNIVDLETVREGRVSNFNDTLGIATGVFAQSRFGAEESRLSIRGSGLQRTFHGRGIKLMQDGIPVNLADGSFDFQAIEPLATRYIEVYRGANALRYGASTLGGAINFISPTGYEASLLEIRGEMGSFDYARAGVSHGQVIGDLDYYIASTQFDQAGFRDNAHQKADRTNANIGYRFSDDAETRFYFGYANSESELPGNLTKSQLKTDPGQSILNPVTLQQKRDIDLWRFANKTTLRFGSTRLELGAFYSDKVLFHPIFQVLDQETQDYGLEARLIHEGTLFGLDNEFVVGLSPSRGGTQEKRWVNNQGRRGIKTNETLMVASNIELYAENRIYLLPELALIAGLQYTSAKRELDDKLFSASDQDESFDVSYTQISPKIGMLYQHSPGIQVYANVSRSFEPPSFGELAGGIKPKIVDAQEGTTLELGSRGNSSWVDWDISAYYAVLNNELLQSAVFAAGNNPVPTSQTANASRTIHAGLEVGLTARFLKHFEWRQNLLINEFRFDDDRQYGDSRLPGIPRSLLRGELMYRKNGFYIGPTIETSPQKYAVDFAETLYADSYTIFGWKMGQQYNKQLSWFLEGRNLTDRKYAATTSVVRDQNGADGALFLPGDGRSMYLGLQWRY